jgi:hypothetical protein
MRDLGLIRAIDWFIPRKSEETSESLFRSRVAVGAGIGLAVPSTLFGLMFFVQFRNPEVGFACLAASFSHTWNLVHLKRGGRYETFVRNLLTIMIVGVVASSIGRDGIGFRFISGPFQMLSIFIAFFLGGSRLGFAFAFAVIVSAGVVFTAELMGMEGTASWGKEKTYPPIGLYSVGALTVLMAAAIARTYETTQTRTRSALSDALRNLTEASGRLSNLFKHMRQAILVFNPEGKVEGEFSQQANVLFGRKNLEGESIEALLYGHLEPSAAERQAFHDWLQVAFRAPAGEWEEISSLAPSHVLLPGQAGQRSLTLEFRPIFVQSAAQQIMVLMTDDTEKVALEKKIQAAAEAHARKVAAMQGLLAGGGHLFVSFLEGTEEKLVRSEELLAEAGGALPQENVEELIQHAHSTKADARGFDLNEVEAVAADIEEKLQPHRTAQTSTEEKAELRTDLTKAFRDLRAHLQQAKEGFVAASPTGSAVLDQIPVQRSLLLQLRELSEARADELGGIINRLTARAFGESFVRLMTAVPTWGEKANRKTRFEVLGREVAISYQLARVLPQALTHLVRNAIVHGIEPADVRAEKGKNAVGLVRVHCSESAAGPSILIEDDGRGLDTEAIQMRAARAGLSGAPEEIIFHSGFSTLDEADWLGGRGVGLAAVRNLLHGVGYEIRALPRDEGRGAAFLLRPVQETRPWEDLPPEFVPLAAHSPGGPHA